MRTAVGELLDIPVEARLYESVTNGAELRRRLAARDLDAAFIDADMVIDLFPVLIAAHQAVESARTGTLTAHSVHAQLLLCLSGGKSLSSALRRFGVGELTTRVLVVVLPPSVSSLGGAAAAAAAATSTTNPTPTTTATATATVTATDTDTATATDTAAGAAAEESTPAPPLTPAAAPSAPATASTAAGGASGASPPSPSPPPTVASTTSPSVATAFDDGVVGVEVTDVAAGLAAGAVGRAAVTAAAYKVSAEELAAGGAGDGVGALVGAIATRVATREVVAK